MSTSKKSNIKTLTDKSKKDVIAIKLPMESTREKEIGREAYKEFMQWRDNRNKVLSVFGGVNLSDYIDDSKYRYITSVFERDGIEDWQGVAHVPMTRNKIGNISGRAIQSMPIGQIQGKGVGKQRRAAILTNLYEYSEDTNKYALTMADVITEAMVCGTAIVYEGHTKEVNLERDVKSDGTIKEAQRVTNKLTTTIVNLEDFYPSTIFVPTVDEMPGAAWREILDGDRFLSKYGTFEKAKDIPAFQSVSTDSFPNYRDDINLRLGDGLIEVIHMYKKNTDEYIILANGFFLNPIKIGDSEEVTTSPLPFKHKSLPFFSMKFDHLSSNFIYGKSMPDKLRESQDQLDIMTNMVYDQSVMALFSPIITSSTDYIEDDFLRPGRRIAIDTGGKSINDSIKELKISPPSGWYQYILDYTKGIIEESSVDALSSGSTSGMADRTTAEAVRTAAAGIASTLSYFGLQIQEAIKIKTRLRVGNILQIYFDPKEPISYKIIGESIQYVNSAFNEFSIENAELSPDVDGKIRRGRKVIEIYENKADMPTGEELAAKAQVEQATTGERIEIVALPATYIRDMFDFDVKVVADKRIEATRSSDQAVAMYKAQTYMTLFPDMVNKDELAANLMEANGDDPTKLLLSLNEQKEQGQQMKMDEAMGGAPGAPGGQGGAPGGLDNNFAANAMQEMSGGAQQLG